ncbi:MAG: tetratricopeptide repeat protein [Phormidium sp.]
MKTHEILRNLANCHRQQGNPAGAIAYYQKSLNIQPNCAKTYREFARFWEQQQQEHQALTCWTQALTLDPQWATLAEHLTLGKRWLRLGKLEQAQSYYHHICALTPQSAVLHRQWGDALMSLQHWTEAISAYQRSLNLDPEDFTTLHQQAACFSGLGDRAAMVDIYLKSIPLNPDFAWYYYPLFWKSLKDENKVLAAIHQFKKTLKQAPDSLNVYINLGDALSLQNNKNEAILYYRQGINLMYSRNHKNSNLNPFPNVGANPCGRPYGRPPDGRPPDGRPSTPNFIILGAQKAGTSSLYAYMTQHPQILPPLRKELEFWSWKFYHGLDWYLAQFPKLPTEGTYQTGEACPNYFDFPDTPKRLASHRPNIKFIILLRNPVNRAISHYHHWRKIHQEQDSLEVALQKNLQNLQPNSPYESVPKNYLERGLYADPLRRWFSYFPREQFLIVQSEVFYRHPEQILRQVYQFLGLPDYPLRDYPQYNQGHYPPSEEKTRQLLAEFYAPYNRDLTELLGEEFWA